MKKKFRLFSYENQITRDSLWGSPNVESRLELESKDGLTKMSITDLSRQIVIPDESIIEYEISITPVTFRSHPRYIEAPNFSPINSRSIFLAGSITGAAPWQNQMAKWLLDETDATILNPRRENFDVNSGLDREQIGWEYHFLNEADLVLYWFSSETVAPITLFELGSHLKRNIIVGCDPDYPRKSDLEHQLYFARPDLDIFTNLRDLAERAIFLAKKA